MCVCVVQYLSGEEDEDEDDEGRSQRRRKMKLRKAKKKTSIYDVYEPSELERGYFTERDNDIRVTDVPERFQVQLPSIGVIMYCFSSICYMHVHCTCTVQYKTTCTCTYPRQFFHCLGCAVLLCLVCLFDLACFFFSSFSSLI